MLIKRFVRFLLTDSYDIQIKYMTRQNCDSGIYYEQTTTPTHINTKYSQIQPYKKIHAFT